MLSPLKNGLRPRLLASQARKGAAAVNVTSVCLDCTLGSLKASAYVAISRMLCPEVNVANRGLRGASHMRRSVWALRL